MLRCSYNHQMVILLISVWLFIFWCYLLTNVNVCPLNITIFFNLTLHVSIEKDPLLDTGRKLNVICRSNKLTGFYMIATLTLNTPRVSSKSLMYIQCTFSSFMYANEHSRTSYMQKEPGSWLKYFFKKANGWTFFYGLSDCGFKSRFSHF